MRRLLVLLATVLLPAPIMPSVGKPLDRSEQAQADQADEGSPIRLRAQLHQAVDRGELDLAQSLLCRLREAQSSQCSSSSIGTAIGCNQTSGVTASGGLHWVFGVPLYVVDVAEMEGHNAALSATIKEQFEELDATGWAADKTYAGASKSADELEPADRNDEFVSLREQPE